MWSSNSITSCMRVPLIVGLCIRVCLPRFCQESLFCRFYRGMMSLPDVKVPLFVADGLCRRMFVRCDDGVF